MSPVWALLDALQLIAIGASARKQESTCDCIGAPQLAPGVLGILHVPMLQLFGANDCTAVGYEILIDSPPSRGMV